ncbi:uncharacterized protein LOC113789706 [Dermatophagoides pteronyssinus]|uniref:uncharacterized protein LOC113789706 n=1 Tax=Dermatophagoides pteronyssinus TaxID=6956 RepID=UPI003F6682EF
MSLFSIRLLIILTSLLSSIESINEWESEEKFCENILKPCNCFVDAQTNLLSVHCKGDDKINNLDQILKRIAQTIDNIQFDELILENFTQIKMIDFTQIQQVPIKTIRIFDCNHLELLINKNSNKNSTQLANSLIELELAGNIAIDSNRLFEFLYTFSRLRSIILSSINYRKIPVLNHTNKCLPWKRLVFNHRCTKNQKQPLTIDRSDQFINLCNIRWLDLSCMNLQHLNRMAILKLCQHLNATTTKGSELHLDLSYNPLLNIDQWAKDGYDERLLHIEF